jgi:transglutaminase-like putative cysteine protease
MMRTYRVRHVTTCLHEARVTAAWQILHLKPLTEAGQECLEFDLDISPRPPDLASRPDFFGNTRHFFTLREPHREMEVTSYSLVRRQEPAIPMAGLTPTLSRAKEMLDAAVLAGEFELEQFRHASPHVPLDPQAGAIASGLDEGATTVLDWILEVGRRFRARFTFDPTATQISTPITQVLAQGRGVCQDFAHLFLSCARHQGLAASYVSGYLLTSPPPGKKRLEGADASHAWVSIYIPGTGWVDYDPTNHAFVGTDHIAVARGRDYSDVSPILGIYTGGGSHRLFVSVTVEPATDA